MGEIYGAWKDAFVEGPAMMRVQILYLAVGIPAFMIGSLVHFARVI